MASKATATDIDARQMEYSTYAPTGETCPACTKPIKPLEGCRRGMLTRSAWPPLSRTGTTGAPQGYCVMVGIEDIGRPVKNAAGRVGTLREVIHDWEDPAKLPSERRKTPTAFVSPERGGCAEPVNVTKAGRSF